MNCEAAFVGGPANGRIQAFPGDEPPLTVVMHTAPRIPWHQWNPDLGAFEVDDPEEASRLFYAERHVYRRQVSQMDDGPLWVFVPESGNAP